MIPVHDLLEGFHRGVEHIERLIKASEALYDAQMYSAAMPLVILAIEEIGKLDAIKDHLFKKTPITKKEWCEITGPGSHRAKLRMRLQRDLNMYKTFTPEKYQAAKKFNEDRGIPWKMTYEKMQNPGPLLFDMAQLDAFKQDCFYLGWKGAWWTFENGLATEEREAVVWLLVRLAKHWMLISILGKRYPGPTEAYDVNQLDNDPDMKRWKKVNEEVARSENHRKFEIFRNVVSRYPFPKPRSH